MPELPEVETLRRELDRAVKNKTIKSAEARWPKLVRPLSPEIFSQKLKNKKILGASRRAKILMLKLSDGHSLLIHLKLTGQLIFKSKDPLPASPLSRGRGTGMVVGGHPQRAGVDNLPNKFTHIIIDFKDGSKLFFNDLRKFGWMRIISPEEIEKFSSEFGVEPLTKEFTLKKLEEILKKYPNRKIKQILLDQKLIAGVGNIYADESCFEAKILPTRIIKTLSPKEIKALYLAIPKILKLSITKGGTSSDTYIRLDGRPGNFVPYLKVYGRKGQKCKRCKGVVKKIKLNGRGTHFCDECQK